MLKSVGAYLDGKTATWCLIDVIQANEIGISSTNAGLKKWVMNLKKCFLVFRTQTLVFQAGKFVSSAL